MFEEVINKSHCYQVVNRRSIFVRGSSDCLRMSEVDISGYYETMRKWKCKQHGAKQHMQQQQQNPYNFLFEKIPQANHYCYGRLMR